MNKKDELYKLVASIPEGMVMTYGHLGAILGVNPRIIGNWLHQNDDPQNIPCHRVVNYQGRLAPAFAFGGPDEQRTRLEAEGVRVNNGFVSLDKYLWNI